MKSLSVFLMCLTVSGTFMTVQAFGAETDCKNIVQGGEAKNVQGVTVDPASPTVKTKTSVN